MGQDNEKEQGRDVDRLDDKDTVRNEQEVVVEVGRDEQEDREG